MPWPPPSVAMMMQEVGTVFSALDSQTVQILASASLHHFKHYPTDMSQCVYAIAFDGCASFVWPVFITAFQISSSTQTISFSFREIHGNSSYYLSSARVKDY
jgi:hypothetical protein